MSAQTTLSGISSGAAGAMPAPLKMGLTVATGGAIIGAIVLAVSYGRPKVAIALGVGAAILLILLVLVKFLLKSRDKGKAAPFSKLLARGGSASAADPAAKARLDDMRKKFEEGVVKFRAAGKDLYSLPWYLLVGPSGSGKTEMVRHSNVGFPPGLQDKLQGAGGTLNMHWWFTNNAVILDTAGRVFMEEQGAGGPGAEWREFLKILRQSRPNCPINGLLLCIGADSLIKDSAEKIAQNAGAIARQLDVIQRTLDVRFPVFVIVTKCDLINGFREFFEHIDDPQLQHQILGWSNPASLDEKFEPERVADHLEHVKQRLVKRRMSLMLDPINTEDPMGRRTDQVDALFALPESMSKITPRLKSYLEQIFVAGEWSPKPLFLRGIYFTSSMRDGAELDSDLAEALGVPVDSLPGGRVWDREISYFLRDCFLAKVFRERGLVTRASNVTKMQRRRKLILMGTALFAVLIVLGIAFLSQRQFKATVGARSEFWTSLEPVLLKLRDAERLGELDIIRYQRTTRRGVYRGDRDLREAAESTREAAEIFKDARDILKVDAARDENRKFTIANLVARSSDNAVQQIRVPFIFRPITLLQGDLGSNLKEAERGDAARSLIISSTLKPTVDAAWLTLVGADAWTPESGEALAQLVRLETFARGRVPSRAEGESVNLDALMKLLLGPGSDVYRVRFGSDRAALQAGVDAVFQDPARLREAAQRVDFGTQASKERIDTALRKFADSFSGEGEQGGLLLGRLGALRVALGEYAAAESRLASDEPALRMPADRDWSRGDYERFALAWQENFAKLSEAKAKAEAALANLPELAGLEGSDLLRKFEDAEKEAIAESTKTYRLLEEQLPPKPGERERISEEHRPLEEIRETIAKGSLDVEKKILAQSQRLREDFAPLSGMYMARGAQEFRDSRTFALRYEMLAAANAELEAAAAPAGQGEIAVVLRDVSESAASAMKKIDDRATRMPADPETASPKVAMVRARAELGVNVANAKRTGDALAAYFRSGAPRTPTEVGERVSSLADKEPSQFRAATIELTGVRARSDFDPQYDPGAAKSIIGAWSAVQERLGAVKPGETPRVLDRTSLRQQYDQLNVSFSEYASDFAEYWVKTVGTEARVRRSAGGWAQYRRDMERVSGFEARVNREIRRYNENRADALKLLDEITLSDGERERIEELVAAFKAEEKALADRGFEEKCRATTSAWLSLPGEDVDAAVRAVFRALGDGSFKREFLAAYEDVEYWRSFIVRALESLVEAADRDSQAAKERLLGLARFPLVRDGSPAQALSREEMQAALDAANILGRARVARGDAPGTRTRVGFREVDALLDKLEARSVIDAADETKLRRIIAVIQALGTEQTVNLLPAYDDEPDERPRRVPGASAVGQLRYFEVFEGDRRLSAGQRSVDLTPPTDVMSQIVRESSVAMPSAAGRPLVYRYYRQQGDIEPVGSRSLAAPWTILELILADDTRARPDNKTFIVAMPIAGADPFFLWMKATLERPLPPLSEWPTAADWIR